MKKQSLYIVLGVLAIVIATVFVNRWNGGRVTSSENEIPQATTTTSTDDLIPQKITLSSGETFDLNIPAGFGISIAAEGLGRARFLAKSPDGRIFVPDMSVLSDNSNGKIYILSGFNQYTKKFDTKTTYLSNLRNPNSLAFYTDSAGVNWLYLALTDKLVRYRYQLDETSPTSKPQTLATFPDYGLNYKYGGWHLTRTVVIHKGKVYVTVGSSCNSCEEKEEIRASIVQMDLDGSNQKIVATGLRNAVGIVSVGDDLYISNMGSDHLGNDRPEETFYKLTLGANYGWPYCYQYQGAIYKDTSTNWKTPGDCSKMPLAMATFPAHSAPLGVEYFDGSFLVALHGSGVIPLKKGYSIVRVAADGKVSDEITGFLDDGLNRNGRPAGILRDTGANYFFTDDHKGVLYYVYKK